MRILLWIPAALTFAGAAILGIGIITRSEVWQAFGTGVFIGGAGIATVMGGVMLWTGDYWKK